MLTDDTKMHLVASILYLLRNANNIIRRIICTVVELNQSSVNYRQVFEFKSECLCMTAINCSNLLSAFSAAD